MLHHTFQHLPGVGPRTEQKLWDQGILEWRIALELPREILDHTPIKVVDIEESLERLASRDPAWFSERLPSSESWRLFPEFSHATAYIDIETNGMGHKSGGEITTICLWDGTELKTYVQGENLRDFQDDILDYSMLVTYNGSSFDLPFIAHWFNIELPHAHIDLRHTLASVGLKGGLKSCEEQVGIARGDLTGVDGMYAVYLWNMFLATSDQSVLDTLIAYNALDVLSLERLMAIAYNRKVEETPFAAILPVEVPPERPLPCRPPSLEVLREIDRAVDTRQQQLRGLAREMLGGSSG